MLNRFKSIVRSLEDITLVFDHGNNSRVTLKEVDGTIHADAQLASPGPPFIGLDPEEASPY